jgi:peptidoglycan/xylan/chitin deacetylase (PgdA/CDA1 family)
MVNVSKRIVLLGLVIVLSAAPFAHQADAQSGGIHLPPPDAPWTVYLTFDDGPSGTITPQILDILDSYGVKGTFFLHGHRIKGNEAIVRRLIREGHAIGNHLWQQPGYTNGSGATDQQFRDTWQKTENEIVRALGPRLAEIYHQQPVFLVRQPGGAAQPFPVPDGIDAITYNWQVSTGDAIPWQPGPDDPPDRPWYYLVGNVTLSWFTPHRYYSVYDYGDGTVILMHDVVAALPVALPYIIEDLLANGASFGVLPRSGDEPGTMPIILSAPPEWYKQN